MIRTFTETILSYKAGIMTALGSPTFVWFVDKMQWFDLNFPKIVAYTSWTLAITMLIGHWCNNIRENKKLQAELKESELRARLLEIQIDEKSKKE